MLQTAYARPLIYSQVDLGIAVPSGFRDAKPYVPSAEFMYRAIEEAERAVSLGQHPVGAVVTTTEVVEDIWDFEKVNGRVEFKRIEVEFGLAAAHNQTDYDSMGHAEVLALREAELAAGGRDVLKLARSVLYTTHIPCPMCAGTIANTKISGVVYGIDLHHAETLAKEGVRLRSNKVSALDIITGVEQAGRAQQFVIGGFMEDECFDVLKLARSLGQ